MKRFFAILTLLSLAVPSMSGANLKRRIELWDYNLGGTDQAATTETFFVLGPEPGTDGSNLIQATASTTVTAVSGTPFSSAAVGDMLIIRDSGGLLYRKAIIAKASGASITVSMPAITLTNASFKLRSIRSGTATSNGSFNVGEFRGYTIQVSLDNVSLTSGGIEIRIQCRTDPDAAWTPAYPVTLPPAAQVPFTATVAGAYNFPTNGVYDSCRVGLRLTGTDDADVAGQQERVSIFTIGEPR